MTQRLNDNKAIRVTWIPVTANKIIHYEVQFRTVDQGTTTLISRDIGLSNGFLSFIINDLSEDSNYEVRVRAIVEAAPEDVGTIGMMAGPWSEWVESRVNDCCKSSLCVCMCIVCMCVLHIQCIHAIKCSCPCIMSILLFSFYRCSCWRCNNPTQWNTVDSIHIIDINCGLVFLNLTGVSVKLTHVYL